MTRSECPDRTGLQSGLMTVRDSMTIDSAVRKRTSAEPHDPRWAAVLARDPAADGLFVYAVKTTGVYARPSSAARLPRPENVEFFASASEAEAAGYRPSRRPAADRSAIAARHAALVAEACRRIEAAEILPDLGTLAADAALSPYHFHRVFKSVTGLTPKAYAGAHRANKVRGQLGQSPSVTEALYDAGFNSNGRFYATSNQVLGMTPTDYRAGGTNQAIRSRLASVRWGPSWWPAANAGCAPFCLATIPIGWHVNFKTNFPERI